MEALPLFYGIAVMRNGASTLLLLALLFVVATNSVLAESSSPRSSRRPLRVETPKIDAPPVLKGSADISVPATKLAPQVPVMGNVLQPKLAGQEQETAPTIYNLIANAGQKVVIDTVVNVAAHCDCSSRVPHRGRTLADPWTHTNITIKPGQRLWLYTNPGAKWGWAPGGYCGVNGLGSDCAGCSVLFKPSPAIPASTASLVAYVSSKMPPGSQPGAIVWNETQYSDQAAFAVGSGKPNFVPPHTGKLSFISNDNALDDNVGFIAVHVIITQAR